MGSDTVTDVLSRINGTFSTDQLLIVLRLQYTENKQVTLDM